MTTKTKDLHDIVELSTRLTGPKDSVLEQAARHIRDQVVDKYGVEPSGTESGTYTVTVQKTATCSTYEEAFKQAVDTPDYSGEVTLELKQNVKVPYFLKSVDAKAEKKEDFWNGIKRDEDALKEKYGSRMVAQPNDVEYRVTQYSDRKGIRQLLKKGAKTSGKILAEGISNTLLEEAEAAAKTKQKPKATIYHGVHEYKIYGDESVTAEAKRSRGGSGAAYTPSLVAATDLY